MLSPSSRTLAALTYLVLVPIGVAVSICTLLLFGVSPRYVFFPGFALKSMLESLGLHAANRVGVIGTGLFWWAIVVSVRLLLRRAPPNPPAAGSRLQEPLNSSVRRTTRH